MEDGETSLGSDPHSDRLLLHDSGRRMRRALAVTSSTRRPNGRSEYLPADDRPRTDLTIDADLEVFLQRARDGGAETSVSPHEVRAVLDMLTQAIAAGGASEAAAKLQLPRGFFPDVN